MDFPQDRPSTLTAIEHDLLEMASRAELMAGRASEALWNLDSAMAQSVIRSDDKVDSIDLRIERACLTVLSAESEGVDLRVVGTILKIVTDIERVGDLAVEIARCAMEIEGELGTSGVVDLPRLAALARSVFHTAIEAYVRQDMALVEQTIALEDEVDGLYHEFKQQLFDLMRTNHEQVVPLANLVLAISHFERIADHGCNIAERVAFMITGEVKTHAPRHVQGP